MLLKTPIRLFDSDPVEGRLELPVLPIHSLRSPQPQYPVMA